MEIMGYEKSKQVDIVWHKNGCEIILHLPAMATKIESFNKHCGAWMNGDRTDLGKWFRYLDMLEYKIYPELNYPHDLGVWKHIVPAKYRLAAFIASFGENESGNWRDAIGCAGGLSSGESPENAIRKIRDGE